MFWYITLLRCSFLNRWFIGISFFLFCRLHGCINFSRMIGFCFSFRLTVTAFTIVILMSADFLYMTFRHVFLLNHMLIQFLNTIFLQSMRQFFMDLLQILFFFRIRIKGA